MSSKKEIYLFAGSSEMQVKTYKSFFSKTTDPQDFKSSYYYKITELKQIYNHPYLLGEVEEKEDYEEETHLITSSGKMIILDKLLQKFSKEGHRVLLFCQFIKMLDIFEDYCDYRQYNVEIPYQTSMI